MYVKDAGLMETTQACRDWGGQAIIKRDSTTHVCVF